MLLKCTQADHKSQQIIGFCLDSACPNQRPYCHFCLPCHTQHLNKLTTQEQLPEWIKDRILIVQNVQNFIQECQIALDSLINFLLSYNSINIQQLTELGLSQIDQLIKGLCQTESCEEQLFKHLQQSIIQIQLIVNEILKTTKNQTNIRKIDNLTLQQCNLDKYISEQQKNQQILKPNLNPFTFDLMNQISNTQDQWCCAVAFNKDYSIVAAGSNMNIKVFQHIKGKMDQIQLLCEHTRDVFTLNFMKNTNNIVSGSQDNSIIIWQVNGNNQWRGRQKFCGHSNHISCLLLNNTDDLIISGSADKSIKFWIKDENWFCQQTITDHSYQVYSISLNEQQNKLISCSYDSSILVIEQQKMDKVWSVIQKIKVDQYGCRLCFINDNQFTFQPYCKQYMHIYEMDSKTKKYKKSKEIAVRCGSSIDNGLFPQQYLTSKCLLVNKNGKNIILISKKENGDFIVQQSIEFSTHAIYGKLSDDGEYLITWDKETQNIQIRKFREL